MAYGTLGAASVLIRLTHSSDEREAMDDVAADWRQALTECAWKYALELKDT